MERITPSLRRRPAIAAIGAATLLVAATAGSTAFADTVAKKGDRFPVQSCVVGTESALSSNCVTPAANGPGGNTDRFVTIEKADPAANVTELTRVRVSEED